MKSFTFIFILSSLLLGGCFRKEDSVSLKEIKGDVFGSYYLVKYYGTLDSTSFLTELNQFFHEFNSEFSTYQKDSVISQFNLLPRNQRMKVSKRFIEMLDFAKELHQETQGAFEPTLGPVIKAWGFGGSKEKKIPTDAEIKEVMKRVGIHKLHWDAMTSEVWKDVDGLQLDVNAFAPGWAADLIGKMLEAHGVSNYMVDISGEIVFKGKKGPMGSWVGGIEKPALKHAEAVQVAFTIEDLALATSGSYRQFFDDNGQRRSHIIDPRNGKPVSHNVSSATVITNSGIKADAWGTAMMVLGRKGLVLAEKNGIKVLLLESEGPNKFVEVISDSMKSYIQDHKL